MLRFDHRPHQNARSSANANLMPTSPNPRDADRKTGGPRYPLLSLPGISHPFFCGNVLR